MTEHGWDPVRAASGHGIHRPDDERERTVSTLVQATGGRGSVLFAVARRDGLSVRPTDLAWCRAAERACSDGPRLLGLHVITVEGSREVPAQAA